MSHVYCCCLLVSLAAHLSLVFRLRGFKLWGFFFEVWLKNQSTVLEAWGPRLAGGGIGYHVMERYTRMNAGLHRASITLQSGKVWHTDG